MPLTHHILRPPWDPTFIAWYPHVHPEHPELHGRPWAAWMRRVVRNDLDGLEHRFFAAKDDETDDWIGACWGCRAPTVPELVHFGWFFVEEDRRDRGIGSEIVRVFADAYEAEGAEMIMIPTQLDNVRAHGMYERRGWRDLIVQPERGRICLMTHAPEGHREAFFAVAPETPLEIGPTEFRDYIALDYLVNNTRVTSRLHPVGLVDRTRFLSMTFDWSQGHFLTARANGRPVGVGVWRETDEGSEIDAFAEEPPVVRETLAAVRERAPGPVTLFVAEDDAVKRETAQALGLQPTDTVTEDHFGCPVHFSRHRAAP